MAGVEGTLVSLESGGRLQMTLTLNRPVPLNKADFFKVYTAIRQKHLVPLGVIRPTLRSQVEEGEGASGILIEVPAQPTEQVDRVVVQGSDKTRAKAVLREIPLQAGDPLDQDKLSQAQGRLGALGAFSRVEVTSLAEPARETGPPSPWKPGDLLFRAEERSPWVVTNSFGYDRTQGYYIGTDVQRLNVGGMGRTLDFDVRAGNGTIHNPTLQRIFSTGQYTNSLDSFTIGYTDPWFIPDWILPDNTSFRLEGGYTEEQRYIYYVHRRRVLSSLMWSVGNRVRIEVGYRFERVNVTANVPGLDPETLAIIARYPLESIISAPYFQWVRDTRDNAFDPTSGMYSVARLEAASQFFLTSKNSSFLKLDLRNQWTWPVGYKAEAGVVALGLRVGIARPTASTSQELPLSERFSGGGSGSERGVQPDFLGPTTFVPVFNSDGSYQYVPGTIIQAQQQIPLGGQALVAANLEYRFPLWSKTVWGELFVDSAQVYESVVGSNQPGQPTLIPTHDQTGLPTSLQIGAPTGAQTPTYPPLRTAVGLGLIFKLGIPVKFEYAGDVNRILGRPRDTSTQLKNVLVSAGFQF
jgi:outer membrane protein assembly factor BamA